MTSTIFRFGNAPRMQGRAGVLIATGAPRRSAVLLVS